MLLGGAARDKRSALGRKTWGGYAKWQRKRRNPQRRPRKKHDNEV